MSRQTTPQAGSSGQGHQALQFPQVTPRRMIERLQLEAPPTESKNNDQHIDHKLARGAPSSRVYHSHRQNYLLDEIGPFRFILAVGFRARFGVPQMQGPPSNNSTRQQVNTREVWESCRTSPSMSQ